MKTRALVHPLAWCAVSTVCAQVAATAPAMIEPVGVASSYEVVERDAHSRVWARVSYATNKLGEVTASTNSYTELATGMHYLEAGKWLESEAKIEILPNNAGAAASRGQHKAIFPLEIQSGVIELALPETDLARGETQWLRSRVWGLAYFDGATGESVLLAEVKASEGQLVGDNTVIYPDAFTEGCLADIKYDYLLSGFEQNVVIRSRLPTPEAFGLSRRSTRLQVITEFVEAPTPIKENRQAGGLADQSLGFGPMSIGGGKAFSVDVQGDTTGEVSVAKEWIRMGEEGRNFLVEEVLYEQVADQLHALPPAPEYNGASLPRRGTGENVIAGLQKLLPQRYAKAATRLEDKRMAQIQPRSSPGFVMDYAILSSTNALLQADTTYYVSGTVNLNTLVIEGGACVKFTNTSAAKITVTGTLDCQTGPYRPAVFTSKDDNTVGETIAGSTGNPTNYNGATYLNGPDAYATYQHLRLAYAGTAINAYSPQEVRHCQFIRCGTAIAALDDTDLHLRNVLFARCGTVVSISSAEFLRGEHVTADQVNKFFDAPYSSAYLTNSILTAVTNIGTNVSLFYCTTNASGNGIYQTVGASSYYLVAGSTNRNAGTTNLNAVLLSDLKSRTTYPPDEITTNFTANTTLSPQAQRDTDLPDLGYHFDPLDYVVSGRTVSANLTLAGGVTLGTYGTSSSYGLGLNSGSFWSEGLPTRLNWIARYNTVQEQSTTNWSASTVGAGVKRISSSAGVNTSFTGWSVLGGTGEHFNDTTDASAATAFAHSQFGGGKFTIDPSSVALTNCLWERVYVNLQDNATDGRQWYLFNNLIFGGTLYYRARGDAPVLRAYDNLFDQTTITRGTSGEYFTHGYNGYVTNKSRLSLNQATDKILTNAPVYQTSYLGKYYYPTNGSLTNLLNAGSRTATSAGLYHYTTATNQVKETNSTIDIGFHYVAVDDSGQPVDTDTDGLADYYEDTNGNGAHNAGDLADFNAPDTDDDQMPDGWEWQHFGTFSRDGTGDYDDDGVDDLAEFNAGSDPNSIQFYTLFANLSVSGNIATGMVTALAGVPAKIAVQADPNLAVASWSAYRSNFVADIGPTDGVYVVYVGIKGQADTSEATWAGYQLTRDTSSPMAVITNPATGIVSQPRIQLQGYSPEPLARVRYDLTNANGSLTNLEGYVVKQSVDTNTFAITTNWFACLELNLAVGTNQVTLRVTDHAGNVTTTNLHYVFVYPTNAPMLSLVWPQDGDLLSGTSFTLRGRLSDPTARVTAEVAGEGVPHSLTGIVERDGKFWIENVPLATGTNQVTISVTDVGTNSTTTNFAVVKSGVELTIDALNPSELNNPYITVYGSINVSTHKLWVNGMEVTNVSSGTWYVEGVPLNEEGTATIQARAIPTADNGGHGTGGDSGEHASFDDPGNPQSEDATTLEANADKPAAVVMVHYQRNRSYLSLTRDESPTKKQTTEIIKWDVQQPGSWFDDYCGGITSGGHMYYVCRSRQWESDGTGTLKSWEDRGGEEVCGVQLYGAPTPYTLAGTWPGESCWTRGYRVTPGGGMGKDEVVARTAHTLYELHPGGKQLSGRKNLFVLTGGAEGVGNPFWPEDDNDKKSYVIPNASVLLGDIGYLDSDGKIYPVLPDGQTRDVTPRVEGSPYYTFGEPVPSKHGLELVQPYSKPTEEPIAGNKIYYSHARPGVLTVLFEAVLTNNGPAWAVTNRVRFEADEISGSTPTWSPDHPGGQPTASGSSLFATLYYTNLPTNNSAFGLKFGRVRLDGEVHDEKCFWVFYLADAYNYPGCGDPNDNPATPPNYFHYYRQTSANYGNPEYGYRGVSEETRPAGQPILRPPYLYYVNAVPNWRDGYTVHYGRNAGKTYRFINVFAYASRHEATHGMDFDGWWPNGWISTNDVDNPQPDSIPSTIEPALGFDPTLTATHPQPQSVSPWDDDQDYTLQHEPAWSEEDADAADAEDWAHPGAQYP